jgi:hypothetical protein
VSNIDKRNKLDEEVFTYEVTKDLKVFIYWNAKRITILSGKSSDKFLSKIQFASAKEAQLIMAKATGNRAKSHPTVQ